MHHSYKGIYRIYNPLALPFCLATILYDFLFIHQTLFYRTGNIHPATLDLREGAECSQHPDLFLGKFERQGRSQLPRCLEETKP
jgi:hypothetical protein